MTFDPLSRSVDPLIGAVPLTSFEKTVSFSGQLRTHRAATIGIARFQTSDVIEILLSDSVEQEIGDQPPSGWNIVLFMSKKKLLDRRGEAKVRSAQRLAPDDGARFFLCAEDPSFRSVRAGVSLFFPLHSLFGHLPQVGETRPLAYELN
jgi:hypothetical protein